MQYYLVVYTTNCKTLFLPRPRSPWQHHRRVGPTRNQTFYESNSPHPDLTSPENGGGQLDLTPERGGLYPTGGLHPRTGGDFTPERGGTSPQNGGGLRQTFDYRKYYTKVLVKKTTKSIIFFKSSSFSRRNSNLHADNTDIFTRRSLI